MKSKIVLLLIAGSFFAGGAALAQTADDIKWVNQCISDNRGEKGATPDIVRKYCACMNNKMDNNETRSITQWEKANPKARVACETEAGWK